MRASLVAAIAAVATLALAPAAMGQGVTDTFYFSHDDSLDGTAGETQSSLFNGVISADAEAQPDDQRLDFPEFLDANDSNNNFTVPPPANLREAFRFTVPDGDQNGTFTVQLKIGRAHV